MHVVVQLPALHIEHIDQHLDVPEDVVLLRRKVLLHERLLTAAVPQVQHQIAEKSHVRVFNVDLNRTSTKLQFYSSNANHKQSIDTHLWRPVDVCPVQCSWQK